MVNAETAVIPKWQVWTGWALSCLPLVAFLPSAAMKIAQPGDFATEWSKSFPAGSALPIGLVELACVVLYFVPATRVLGAILTTGYLGGAVVVHVMKGEIAFVVPVLIGVMMWGGLFLRDLRIRQLIPVTKGPDVRA